MDRLNYKHIFLICFIAISIFSTLSPIGPNDISRYLNIISIVKDHSLVIDDGLKKMDTMDKIYINGYFYSDKPPLFAITFSPIFYVGKLPGVSVYNPYLYKISIILIMGTFFAFAMALFYKEYVERFSRHKWLLLLLIFATPYYVFNRVLMSHALVGSLLYIAFYYIRNKEQTLFITLAGILSGLAIAYDHGAVFIFLSFLLYLILSKRIKQLVWLVLFSLLPLLAHLLVVYQLSGSFLPLNMQSELFNYPGSAFAGSSGSGSLKHANFISLGGYILALLFMFPFGYQSKGLFLTAPILIFAFIQMIREAREKKTEAISLLAGILMLFFYYALSSNNLAGGDYAVRWFIIFMPLCLPYIVKYYDSITGDRNARGWFNFALVISLLISFLYSFVSWLGGITPLI